MLFTDLYSDMLRVGLFKTKEIMNNTTYTLTSEGYTCDKCNSLVSKENFLEHICSRRYYPSVSFIHKVRDRFSYLLLKTTLRVKYKDIWYNQFFMQEATVEHDIPKVLQDLNHLLHQDIYLHMHLGNIDLNLVDSHGMPIYKISDTQESEEERLLKIFNN